MRAFKFNMARRLILAYLPVIATLVFMGLIAYGAALIYLPAGFIVGGFLGILAVIDSQRPEKPRL